MQILQSLARSLTLSVSAAMLLTLFGGLAAQGAEEKPENSAARPQGSSVTGTVERWTGSRIDLKTREGKIWKVAVNKDTERLTEIESGKEVTIEYRRKISGFIIALRVLPGVETTAPPQEPSAPESGAATGEVVSWSEASLILRTETGEVTFFLSPATEKEVSLASGLAVTVDYRVTSDQAKLATRVRASEEPREPESPEGG